MLTAIESKLLIVDDLPENLLALEALIRGEGRRVFAARSGEEALELLLQHEFALAILDVQMPDMNGFELAELMRGTERTRHIPLVFVSAAGRDRDYAFTGYEHGAVDFLHKPLDIPAVKSKVTVFVELFRQREAIKQQVQALETGRQEQETLLSELRATQDELQQAVRMRDDLMSIVSHEVRTPLNGLILDTQLRRLQLAKGNMAAFTLDKLQAMTARDERQILSLIRLIEDMLDVSRIRTGKLSIRPAVVDLTQLVAQVLENFAARIAAAGCTVSFQAPDPIVGLWDGFRLEQVIVNLLSNALRYGAKKPIEIRLALEPIGARLEVRDQGIGICAADQARIFQQFERVCVTGVTQGLGLGLYITEQIVLAHQGSIKVHSRLGEGALFCVRLPLAPPGGG